MSIVQVQIGGQPVSIQPQVSGLAKATALIRGFEDTLDGAVSVATASATASAATATTKAAEAEADATQAAADRVQTGLDRVATGADADATAADRIATADDAVATAADRVQTAADRVQTGLDRIATAADVALAEAAAIEAQEAIGITPGVTEFTIRDSESNIMATFTPTVFDHPEFNTVKEGVAEAVAVANKVVTTPGAVSGGFKDEEGNVFFEATETEILHPAIDAINASVKTLESGRGIVRDPQWNAIQAIAQLMHVLFLSQSLGIGWASTALSTTALTGAKMFVGGVRTYVVAGTSADNHATLTDLLESTYNPSGTNLGETPAYGCAQMILQLLESENGITAADLGANFLFSAPGDGSKKAADLASGTVYFDRLKEDVTYGRARGDDTTPDTLYDLLALCMIQGEADYQANTAAATWKTTVEAIRTDAQTWKQAEADTARTLPMLWYQTPSHLYYGRTTPSIALAQLELCETDEHGFAGPIYFMPFADQVHLTNIGYKWMGAYFGLLIKRWLFDGYKPAPLVPTRVEAIGNALVATFPVDPGKKLVLDTTTVAAQTNYGFTMADSGGSAITVTGVSIVGPDKVVVQTASARSAGDVLRCGWIGNANIGLINLRDNTGDSLIFDPSGINKPMHKWAPIFAEAAV